MMLHHPPQHPGTKRPGQTLVMFVLLTPALLGMVGLTIDGGLMLVTHRQTQNAADAAALAAAVDLNNNLLPPIPQNTAQPTSRPTTTCPMPPPPRTSTSPPSPAAFPASIGSASNNYAEAIITYPFQTSFIQVLGVNSSQQVTARAVAGYERRPPRTASTESGVPGGMRVHVFAGHCLAQASPIDRRPEPSRL